MQDQQFIQQWNARHDRFSIDFDRGLGHIIRHFSRSAADRKPIGEPYRLLGEAEPRPALSPAARASLRGLAASVLTFVLWVTVMLVATPAPGLASPLDAPAAPASECIGHPMIA